ncbi:hypothetical protein Tco_0922326 [Tanacetum coccineum]|uniref:Uncharacterized protein n=1 Tax=Tanacetum coccineum TaxID=301880 RepID=A0ABQ5D0L2_9ASTR
MFINSRVYLNDEYVVMTRNYFLRYTQLDIPEFHDTLVQFMEYVKSSIDKRALHKREYDSRVNEIQMQITKEKVDTSKALDDNYDEELMAENAEQCHDIRPLPAKLTDSQITELSNQSLESKNICLKKIVAQFQKYFEKLEAHCINLELQRENNVLKSGQQSQFLKEANIKLEHKVAKLLKENETLKKHYKEQIDSIKIRRAKTTKHTTSLIAKMMNSKLNFRKKVCNCNIKNELRKLTSNSVNTKFVKPSILGKSVLQPNRNQSVARQPTTFKSERPRISKQRFASQVDVDNDLTKPVTTHYFPKGKESACAKPYHMIAPSSSRYSSNDMIHNHYLEEAKKRTQESGTLNLSAGTSFNPKKEGLRFKPRSSLSMTFEYISSSLSPQCQMTSDHNSLELGFHNHNNDPYSSKLVLKVVPSAVKKATSKQELELLFHYHITMLRSTL